VNEARGRRRPVQASDVGTEQPGLVSVEEVARAFSVSTSTIYDRIAHDTFPVPHVRIGKLIRFRRTDVEAFVGNGGA
jgi:excisionase family DNA binding protein